jgi:predicted NAD-dependent protein-ADP-ribosyltransferase YbiA (DUF1768 family)
MPITFTKSKLPYGWLGCMSAFPLEYNNQTWKTAEALFQALRFDDESIREQIRNERSPMGAKIKAKQHAEWMTVEPASEQDLQNMEMVLRLKIQQHPQLATELKNTGTETIIEDVTNRPNGRHVFWGMALKDGEWKGENTLGKIWMKIREGL